VSNQNFDTHQQELDSRIEEFIADLTPDQSNYEAVAQQLQDFIFQLINESKHAERINQLKSSYTMILEKLSSSITPGQNIQLLLWLGHKYEQLGEWVDALEAFGKVVELSEADEFYKQKAEASLALDRPHSRHAEQLGNSFIVLRAEPCGKR